MPPCRSILLLLWLVCPDGAPWGRRSDCFLGAREHGALYRECVRVAPSMASMKDIAERVGVSITTVSHALNGTRPVAPETQRKIEEVIRELGFYKNVHAR